MSTSLTRSYVAMTYLMGARGDALVERVPQWVAEVESRLLRGLCSGEREVRARHLAVSVRELAAELEQRTYKLGAS
jgi:hypothetical protein